MASYHRWDGYQAACRFERNAIRYLVVWGPEAFHLINRKSTPCDCIFSLFLPHLAVAGHCSQGFSQRRFLRDFTTGTFGRLGLGFPSFCKLLSCMLSISTLSSSASRFFDFPWVFCVCLRLRGRGNIWGFRWVRKWLYWTLQKGNAQVCARASYSMGGVSC